MARAGSLLETRVPEAMDAAVRLLAHRARSEHEIRTALMDKGFTREEIDDVLERLRRMDLVDDLAFARSWVESRIARGRSRTMVLHELDGKGVARDVSETALAASGLDDGAQAREIAQLMAGRLSSFPLRVQATRIVSGLIRRGFDEEVAEAAARAVLPPEGWD